MVISQEEQRRNEYIAAHPEVGQQIAEAGQNAAMTPTQRAEQERQMAALRLNASRDYAGAAENQKYWEQQNRNPATEAREAVNEVEFYQTHTKLGDGSYITNEAYNALSETHKEIANRSGLDALNRSIDNERHEVEAKQTDEQRVDQAKQARESINEMEFYQAHTQVGDGQYITNESYNALPPRYQDIVKKDGLIGLNKAIANDALTADILDQKNAADIQRQQAALLELKPYYHVDQVNPEGKKRGESYDISQYLWDHPGNTRTLIDAGFKPEQVKSTYESVETVRASVNKMSEQIQQGKLKIADRVSFTDYYGQLEGDKARLPKAQSADIKKAWNSLSDEQKIELTDRFNGDSFKGNLYLQTVSKSEYQGARDALEQGKKMSTFDVAGVIAGTALLVVPVVGGTAGRVIGGISGATLTAQTAKNWRKMAGWEKGLSIVGDVAIVSSVPGSMIRGARGVQGIDATTRSGRIKGAILGYKAKDPVTGKVIREAGAVNALFPSGGVQGEITSQPKLVINNFKNVMENVLDPRKIPETVVTTSHGTVRYPITKNTTAAEAMVIRDRLMELAAKGEKPIVKINGQEVQLSRSPLMEANKGGLVTASPMGEAFEQGLKVAYKPGQRELEQGLFVSHEPLPRFATSTARGVGGEKPIFYIFSKKTSAKLSVSSKKTYVSGFGEVAEMERKFDIGVDVPAPKQKLYTRIDGERVEIWLEKPLSKVAIAKLKAKALVYGATAVTEPAITIKNKGKGLTKAEVEYLANALNESGERRMARTLSRSYQTIRQYNRSTGRQAEIRRETSRIDSRDAARTVEVRNTPERRGTTTERRSAERTEPDRVNAGLNRTIPANRITNLEARTLPPTESTALTNTRIPPTETRTPPADMRTTLPPDRVPPPDKRTPPPDKRTPPPPPTNPDITKKLKASGELETKGAKPVHTAEDRANAVTWKQGIGYWIVFPDKLYEWSKDKPDGIKEVAGPDKNKPAATIQVFQPKGSGKRIVEFNADLGIQDIKVRKQGKRILDIQFKQDRHQSTNSNIRLGRQQKPYHSIKQGKIFRTRIGKGEVISREPL